MTIPTLLVTPEESRTRNGPVVPSVSTGTTVVQGQYGQAWEKSSTGLMLTVPAATTFLSVTQGTMILRLYIPAHPYTVSVMENGNNTGRLLIYHMDGGIIRYRIGDTTSDRTVANAYSPGVIAMSWKAGGERRDYWNGAFLGSMAIAGPINNDGNLGIGWFDTDGYLRRIESILFFDRQLTDAEIASISLMPARWTWARLARQPAAILDLAGVQPTIGGT